MGGEEHDVVVAQQRLDLGRPPPPPPRQIHEQVNDADAVRPAVDVVAEEKQPGVARRPRRDRS